MNGNAILALDITDDCVAGVSYIEDRKSLSIQAHHCSIRSEQVSLEAALAEVVEQCAARGARCHVSFGPEAFLFRSLRLPFSDPKKVQPILPFEIQDSVSLAEDTYVFDCLLEESPDGGTEVLVAVLEKELLREWLSLLHSHDLDPAVVTISSLLSALNIVRLQKEKRENIVLLDIGFRQAQLLLVGGGTVRALRSLAYDIQQRAHFSYAGTRRDVVAAEPKEVRPVLDQLSGEIHNTLFALQAVPQKYLEDVSFRITGPVGSCPKYHALLVESLGQVPVNREPKPYSGMKNLDAVISAWPPGFMDDALALACSSARDRALINFRKEEFAVKDGDSGRLRLLKVAAAGLAIVLTSLFVYLSVDYRLKANRQNQLSEEISEVYRQTLPGAEPGRDPLNELRSRVNEMQGTDVLGSGLDPDITAVNLLADISARIPVSMQVSIERFIYDRKSVRVRGLTDNFNTVDQMTKVLEDSPYYSDVSIGSANTAPKEEGVRFELKLQL